MFGRKRTTTPAADGAGNTAGDQPTYANQPQGGNYANQAPTQGNYPNQPQPQGAFTQSQQGVAPTGSRHSLLAHASLLAKAFALLRLEKQCAEG